MTITAALDYASVLVFAASGALVASRAQLDVFGFVFLACLTAVGGGTLRDLLIGRDVFWIGDPMHLGLASAVALVVFFTAHLLESRYRVLVWIDALALSIAVAAGVTAARAHGMGVPVILVMGVATGTFGGLMRDVVANEVPLVLKEGELYATAAFAGAAGFVLASLLTDAALPAALACMGVTFTLRAGSLAFGWHLPAYKPRPRR